MRGRGGFGRRLVWRPLVPGRRTILPRRTGCLGLLIPILMIGVFASIIIPLFIR